jgi:tetratricopeptide (TPR) repeat protein
MNNILGEQTSEIEFLDHLAFSLFNNEHFLDSAICYKRIIELDPSHAKAHYNLGVVLHDTGQFDYSLLYYEKAKELGYNCSRVNLNIGMHFLKLRDFKNGFDHVDLKSGGAWRLGQNFDVNKDRLSDIDLWEGQNPQGKNILVYSEQGFGDNIQFSRYLPELSRLSDNVTFLCYDVLAPVFRNSHAFDGIAVLDSVNEYVIDLDYRIPLMSVPRLIEATSDNIPLAEGYLEKTSNKDWGLSSDKINVAVAWEATKKDSRRSISLDLIKNLCDNPKINFINIQRDSEHDIDGVMRVGDRIQDFTDTVDILSQCDLLVSTDTAMTHVGGALGVPTYLLLHYSADWRWFTHDMDYSPWYESVSIFRQKTPQDWVSPINEVKKRFRILLNQGLRCYDFP